MVKNGNPRIYNSRGGNATKFPLQSTVNKPIKTIYKKKSYAPKTAINQKAIVTLSKQVRLLQNQRAGETQTHTQWCQLTGAANLPTAIGPVLFGLNNFYDQSIYKGTIVSGVAPAQDVPAFITVGTMARQTYRTDLSDEYEWNARRNTDVVSSVEYKPIFTRLNLKFTFNPAQTQWPGKIRVTILKLKPFSSSNKLNVSLPSTLGAYRWLANGFASDHTNYFDKTYHTILSDKWISVRPPANSALTQFDREMRLDYKFDASILKPDITTSPADQTFWTNVPIKQQLWCLISVDGYTQASLTNVYISKFDVWRDPHGV